MASKIGVKTTPHQLLALILLIAGKLLAIVSGDNYGCSVGLCCDDDGSCTTWNEGGSCSFDTGLDAIVTDSFFNGIKQQPQSSTCPGINFYSRSAFLNASNSYPEFGTTGSQHISLREIAAFFAQVTYATGSFCYIEAINRASNCDNTSTLWPCNPSKDYYGRGPIQLTWNVNYGPAGKSIGFDGLNSPETVANDPVISFKTAFWFWKEYVHSKFTSGQGFGATTRAINPTYCDGEDPKGVSQMVQFYTQYCKQLGVTPGGNLSC